MRFPTRFLSVALPLAVLCAAPLAQAQDLTTAGFGKLNGSTAFNQKAIQAALPPGYTAKRGTASTEGEKRTVYIVTQANGQRAMTLEDGAGKVGQIILDSAAIAAPGGARVGATYSALFPAGKARCSPGSEEDSGTVFCNTALPSILYQFAGQWDGADGEVPPQKILSSWKVKRIIWTYTP